MALYYNYNMSNSVTVKYACMYSSLLVWTKTYMYPINLFIQGLKLMQLKNPWSHKRWKVHVHGPHIDWLVHNWYHQIKQGNYSENDRQNWTPELRKALNFDQMQALQVDNGNWYSLPELITCILYIPWDSSSAVWLKLYTVNHEYFMYIIFRTIIFALYNFRTNNRVLHCR